MVALYKFVEYKQCSKYIGHARTIIAKLAVDLDKRLITSEEKEAILNKLLEISELLLRADQENEHRLY